MLLMALARARKISHITKYNIAGTQQEQLKSWRPTLLGRTANSEVEMRGYLLLFGLITAMCLACFGGTGTSGYGYQLHDEDADKLVHVLVHGDETGLFYVQREMEPIWGEVKTAKIVSKFQIIGKSRYRIKAEMNNGSKKTFVVNIQPNLGRTEMDFTVVRE